MKITELKQKPKDEIEKILIEKKEALRQLNFDLSSGKVKNIRQIKEAKKDIARIMTFVNQKITKIEK